jgi:hypothetical protein
MIVVTVVVTLSYVNSKKREKEEEGRNKGIME